MRRGDESLLRDFFPFEVADRLLKLSSVLVSFSGGVDSSAILALLAGIMPDGTVHSVLFDSFLHPEREKGRAVSLCRDLGVDLRVIPGPELSDDRVMGNLEGRCAFCKELRICEILRLKEEMGIEAIVDGTNHDDLQDPTRLGNSVLNRYPVFSPLAEAGLSKRRVRELAKALDIPWWNETATACMATRFPLGTALRADEAKRAFDAEECLKELGLEVRVRVWNDSICLELFPYRDETMVAFREPIVKGLKSLGFRRIMVDLEGYSTGRTWP